MSIIELGFNIDHVATLRQARGASYPDPVEAALVAARAGADSITLHLREDRRHINDRDVSLLKKITTVPINLEIAATNEMLTIAEKIQPEHVCLVPEKREELTTEGGLDVVMHQEKLTMICQRLQSQGIEVALFVDAQQQQIDASLSCGAQAIELHTGHYANAKNNESRNTTIERLRQSAEYAANKGLIVNAGHGLHYHNVAAVAAISQLQVLNIGHSIVAHAVWAGLENAIKEMKALMNNARLLAKG